MVIYIIKINLTGEIKTPVLAILSKNKKLSGFHFIHNIFKGLSLYIYLKQVIHINKINHLLYSCVL